LKAELRELEDGIVLLTIELSLILAAGLVLVVGAGAFVVGLTAVVEVGDVVVALLVTGGTEEVLVVVELDEADGAVVFCGGCVTTGARTVIMPLPFIHPVLGQVP
jgi:hypothetical protein